MCATRNEKRLRRESREALPVTSNTANTGKEIITLLCDIGCGQMGDRSLQEACTAYWIVGLKRPSTNHISWLSYRASVLYTENSYGEIYMQEWFSLCSGLPEFFIIRWSMAWSKLRALGRPRFYVIMMLMMMTATMVMMTVCSRCLELVVWSVECRRFQCTWYSAKIRSAIYFEHCWHCNCHCPWGAFS